MKRYTKLALKIIFSVVLLAILITRADLEAVGEVLLDASVTWIAAGTVLGIPAMVAAGIRWGQISGYLGVPLPWRFAILGYLEGVTFNLLLPGSVGGDVLRVSGHLHALESTMRVPIPPPSFLARYSSVNPFRDCSFGSPA